MTITEGKAAVLAALRGATDIKREPRTLTADGHEHWHTLARLTAEGWLEGDGTHIPVALSSAARSLRKEGLIAGRTQYTVTRYAITQSGRALLSDLEERAHLTGALEAQTKARQADHDAERWQQYYDHANDKLVEAQRERRIAWRVATRAEAEAGRPLAAALAAAALEGARHA